MLSLTVLSALVLTAAPDPGAAERLVADARREYRRGSMEDALPLYEKAIAAGAGGGRLFYETAQCLKATHGETAGGEMLERAIPELESAIDATPPPDGPEPFYYLATIYLHDMGQGVKGVPLAQQAVKLYEEGAFKELSGPDDQFRMGRLFEMATRKDEAIGFYEKAIAGYDSSDDPDVQNLATALKEAAFSLASNEEWARAADYYERVLDMTELPERDRFSAAVVMLRADRFEPAGKALAGFTQDALATEASYILRILEKYEELEKPALPAEPAVKDDAWLQQSIVEAAAELGAIRSEEAKVAFEVRKKRVEEERARQAPPAGKGSKFGPPPRPVIIKSQGPVVPPSKERLEAERRFFSLMAEYVRRGNLVRTFALSAGIAQLIFR